MEVISHIWDHFYAEFLFPSIWFSLIHRFPSKLDISIHFELSTSLKKRSDSDIVWPLSCLICSIFKKRIISNHIKKCKEANNLPYCHFDWVRFSISLLNTFCIKLRIFRILKGWAFNFSFVFSTPHLNGSYGRFATSLLMPIRYW